MKINQKKLPPMRIVQLELPGGKWTLAYFVSNK